MSEKRWLSELDFKIFWQCSYSCLFFSRIYFSPLEEPKTFCREWVIVQKIQILKVKLHAGRIILKNKTVTITS